MPVAYCLGRSAIQSVHISHAKEKYKAMKRILVSLMVALLVVTLCIGLPNNAALADTTSASSPCSGKMIKVKPNVDKKNRMERVKKTLPAGSYQVRVLGMKEGGRAWRTNDKKWHTSYHINSDNLNIKVITGSYKTKAKALAESVGVNFVLPDEEVVKFSVFDKKKRKDSTGALHLCLTSSNNPDPNPNPNPNPTPKPEAIDWSANATSHRSNLNKKFVYSCSASGTLNRIWGTDVYTDDSSICSAAVHAGKITSQQGGKVTIEMLSGKANYGGSERNGVASSGYGNWTGSSYQFVN